MNNHVFIKSCNLVPKNELHSDFFIILLLFLCSVDRASWYNLRQWPTWYTLALFYNSFTTIPYMFRALHAHHQGVELYWCSIWFHPLSKWPSGARIERELSSISTCIPDSHLLRVTIPDAASIQFNLLIMSI